MFDPPPALVTLSAMRAVVAARGTTLPKIAAISPIPLNDLADLASADVARAREPWLDEAYMIARVLGVATICDLIGQPLDAIVVHERFESPVAIWRSGMRLPLSDAIAITRAFGLSDPYDLYEIIRLRSSSPVLLEAWSGMAQGERFGPLGICPWCGEAGAHRPTCIPDLMWGSRDTALEIDDLRPRVPGKRQNGISHFAPGLKAIRERAFKTQAQMADSLGISLGHYSKLEGCKAKLTGDLAHRINHKFGVPILDIVSPPGAGE